MSGGRRIAIAMDGSEYSEYAFQWYLDNIRQDDDHVVVVFCPEYHNITYSQVPVMTDVSLLSEALEEEQRRVTKIAEEFGHKLKHNKLHGKVRSIPGKAGEVICKVAEEEDAVMIVTGTRGMGTIRRTFTGSVSDYVLHHSSVPVVVCRHKDHHKHHGTHSAH